MIGSGGIAELTLSVAKRHGLIEAHLSLAHNKSFQRLSVAKRHGLIEASWPPMTTVSIPGLSVAKRHGLIEADGSFHGQRSAGKLSVAKRHGLIEACICLAKLLFLHGSYPWQNATASLKRLRHSES